MRKRKRKQQKKNRRKNIIWYSVFLIVVLTGIFIISGRDDSLVLTETKRNQIINSNEGKKYLNIQRIIPLFFWRI